MTDYSELYLTDEQFLAGLKRIRAAIAAGRKFVFLDSDAMGDKYTHCNWGACGDEPGDWPDKGAHMWPDCEPRNGKISIKYRTDNQPCPFDKLGENDNASYGCFYRCMAKKTKKRKHPSRVRALELFDATIGELQQRQDERRLRGTDSGEEDA